MKNNDYYSYYIDVETDLDRHSICQVTEIVNVKAKIQTQIWPTLKRLQCLLSQGSHLFKFTHSLIYVGV